MQLRRILRFTFCMINVTKCPVTGPSKFTWYSKRIDQGQMRNQISCVSFYRPVWSQLNESGLLTLAKPLFPPPLWRAPSFAVAPETVLYNGCGSAAFLEPFVFAIGTVLALNDKGCACHLLECNVLFVFHWYKKDNSVCCSYSALGSLNWYF